MVMFGVLVRVKCVVVYLERIRPQRRSIPPDLILLLLLLASSISPVLLPLINSTSRTSTFLLSKLTPPSRRVPSQKSPKDSAEKKKCGPSSMGDVRPLTSSRASFAVREYSADSPSLSSRVVPGSNWWVGRRSKSETWTRKERFRTC